jgi:hypothetical protein
VPLRVVDMVDEASWSSSMVKAMEGREKASSPFV